MENLMRIRGRLAWALVVLAVLTLAFQVVQLTWYLQESVHWYSEGSGSREVTISISWVFGWQGVDYALMLALVVAAAACWVSPAVPRARGIALAAAWTATLTVALPWAAVVFSLLISPETALGSVFSSWEWWLSVSLLHPLITSGVGVVAAIALWALARRPAEQVEDEDRPDGEAESADTAELDAAEDEHPTVWKPSDATGTVWRTADEAAAGAPGSRSLASGKTSSGTEWAQDASRLEPGPSDDWRPPANS